MSTVYNQNNYGNSSAYITQGELNTTLSAYATNSYVNSKSSQALSQVNTDTGDATVSASELNLHGGTGISTSATGSTISIVNTAPAVPIVSGSHVTVVTGPSNSYLTINTDGNSAGNTNALVATDSQGTIHIPNGGNVGLVNMYTNHVTTLPYSPLILQGSSGQVILNNQLQLGENPGQGQLNINSGAVYGIDGINVGSTAQVVTESNNQLGTAVITAGTGISVTPGANTITIANTQTPSITLQADSGSSTGQSFMVSGGSTGLTTTETGSTVSLTGTLAVSSGGTGENSFSNTNGLIVAGSSSTSPLVSIANGASGKILYSQGTSGAPYWSAPSYSVIADNGNIVSNNNFTISASGQGSTVKTNGSGATISLSLEDGSKNIMIGQSAGGSLSSGNANTCIGYQSGKVVSTGYSNLGVGAYSLNALTTGSSNTCVGQNAGGSFVSGTNNVLLGCSSGANYNNAESGNICIGANVYGTTNESNHIRIGNQGSQTSCQIAGINGVDLATANVVTSNSSGTLGSATLTAGSGIAISTSSNAINISSTVTSGIANLNADSGSAISGTTAKISGGVNSGSTVSTSNSGTTTSLNLSNINTLNTCLGYDAGGASSSQLSGTDNTALGCYSLYSGTTAQGNVALGYASTKNLTTGQNNVGVGTSALQHVVTGSLNVALGFGAGSNNTTGDSNNVYIGHPGGAGENNYMRLGLPNGGGTNAIVRTNIAGTTDGSQADAYCIGEVATNYVIQASPVTVVTASTTTPSLQTGTIAISSLNLTPGCWMITGNITVAQEGAAEMGIGCLISTSSAPVIDSLSSYTVNYTNYTNENYVSTTAPVLFVNRPSTTTYYLICQYSIVNSTDASGWGQIQAVRIR